MKYWESPQFKDLQKAWYEKLRRGGFEDQEELRGFEMVMKPEYSAFYLTLTHAKLSEIEITTRESYYYTLGQKLEERYGSFRNPLDRLIVSLFAMGTKVERIYEILKRQGTPRCRNTIRFTIRKYEVKWGMRTYTRKQLNLRDRKVG